jgi:hypothetical protein
MSLIKTRTLKSPVITKRRALQACSELQPNAQQDANQYKSMPGLQVGAVQKGLCAFGSC